MAAIRRMYERPYNRKGIRLFSVYLSCMYEVGIWYGKKLVVDTWTVGEVRTRIIPEVRVPNGGMITAPIFIRIL